MEKMICSPFRSLPVVSLRKPLNPFPSLQTLRRCSSVAVETLSANGGSSAEAPPHHPWPEWVSFVDCLKSKGYFMKDTEANHDDIGERGGGGGVVPLYKNVNLLKDPCLSFARDRYDIFKSLSGKDIKTVVQSGCPTLLRKVVNSAKRLRAYVKLDEGDVCSACNLRGSCDRAYVILKESESAARTVDIVRILLFYALNPPVSVEDGPPSSKLVESSTRKLLSELTQLSETPSNPALPKPAHKGSEKKEKTVNVMDDKPSQNAKMTKEDWMCPKCKFLNFSKHTRCLKCQEDGPRIFRKGNVGDFTLKKGDWICTECKFVNFFRNIRCLACKAECPKQVGGSDVVMKKGDWNCPRCSFMNYASRRDCLRCRESRPKRQLNPGEWECPSCDFMNFRKNVTCQKCEASRP